MKAIRVLIVDDSVVVQKIIQDSLKGLEDIEVIGTAANPYVARDKILALNPDVVTLDIEMPRMDGLTFLGKLMKYHPVPVIILSSHTPRGSQSALRAFELGAVEVFCKPHSESTLKEMTRSLVNKIRTAAMARVRPVVHVPRNISETSFEPEEIDPLWTQRGVLAMGASTGGTVALKRVLEALPSSTPGTVIVLHMPPYFTTEYAKNLDRLCPMQVLEAKGGEILRPGLALIAPGDHHLLVLQKGAHYVTQLRDGPQVHYQRPAVDVLFHSVAKNVGNPAVGVLLTGMGADGARGLLAMHQAGAHTIAQNEETCVIYGMPKKAVELGAVESILPLENISKEILKTFKKPLTVNPA